MFLRILLPAWHAVIFVSATVAQPVPPGRELPPDQKAYTEAIAIADPEEKIAALTRFKTNFPESINLRSADQAILTTLVKKLPAQTSRIRKFAAGMYRMAPARSRGTLANQIALQLLGADLLLKDAAAYARASIDAMVLSSYISDQLAGYRERQETPPWTHELEKRFHESRAVRGATLGRIEIKLGNIANGRRLLEEAYAAQPTNASVQAALGELAAKSGDPAKALEYLIPARLSGGMPAEANAALEAVYRRQHGNSLEGLEDRLDREYRRRFPNPLTVQPYQPAASRSDRMVLAEVFTASGCGPCAAADLAFDAAMERYSRKDLAVVMYHQHIPRPDPMTNPDNQARSKSFGVVGVPTFAIDGKKIVSGGGREMTKPTYDRFRPEIEKQLEAPAEALLKAEASLSGAVVSVKAWVERVKSASKDLKVHIALVEKFLRFSGENGIRFHPMVVRAMGGTNAGGFPLDSIAGGTFEQSFHVDQVSDGIKAYLDQYEAGGHHGEPFTFAEKMYRINRADLAVVVFVQDDKTKHVLQTAYIDLSPEPAGRVVTEAGGSR